LAIYILWDVIYKSKLYQLRASGRMFEKLSFEKLFTGDGSELQGQHES